jgi:hypothetical protein
VANIQHIGLLVDPLANGLEDANQRADSSFARRRVKKTLLSSPLCGRQDRYIAATFAARLASRCRSGSAGRECMLLSQKEDISAATGGAAVVLLNTSIVIGLIRN